MRKAGLWDMKMRITGGGIPTMSMQQCTDAATDKDLRTIYSPLARETCNMRPPQKTATGYTADRICKKGDDTITTHIDVTGDYNSAYQAHRCHAPRTTRLTIRRHRTSRSTPNISGGARAVRCPATSS